MNAPPLGAYEQQVATPVRRPKQNVLRRHWLTGALICTVVGFCGYLGLEFHRVEVRLAEKREARAQLDEQVREARRTGQKLETEIARVTDDRYREYMAKSMGFVHPQETVYQAADR